MSAGNWTEAEIEWARTERRRGKSIGEIAIVLGYAVSDVEAQLAGVFVAAELRNPVERLAGRITQTIM